MAQVPGIVGSAACTSTGQKNATALKSPTITETSASFTHVRIGGGYYRETRPGYSLVTPNVYPYTLYFSIRKADGSGGVSNRKMGTLAGPAASLSGAGSGLQVRSGSPLTANTNYVLSVHTDQDAFNNASRPNSARIGTRVCFRTGPSASQMSRPNSTPYPGGGTAGGCFAFGGTPEQVRACFCGARNASGTWAQDDSGDGYSYLVNAAMRTQFGCTAS